MKCLIYNLWEVDGLDLDKSGRGGISKMLAAGQRKTEMVVEVQHERDTERSDKYLQVKLYWISCRTGYGFREI